MRSGRGRRGGNSAAPDRVERADRAQSAVLGTVLIIGIAIAGTVAVVAFGASVLADSQTNSEIGSVEHAMTQLDSQISLVALGETDRQRVRLDRNGNNLYVDPDAGWMNVSIVNESTGEIDMVVTNVSMGAVIYENEGTTIAYQGGGVWRSKAGGSTMVSPPEFHYRIGQKREPTLTLPLVVVNGGGGIGNTLEITKNGTTTSKYPVVGNSSRSNPLTSGEVNVTVHSEYYEAWGVFFEERTDGAVVYNHPRKTVTITLRVPSGTQNVDGGVVSSASGAAGRTINMNSNFLADAYNSSEGDYSSTVASDGVIIISGDVKMTSNARIEGTLKVGGTIDMQNNNNEITGDLYYGSLGTMKGTVGGDKINDPPTVNVDPVTDLIEDKLSTIKSSPTSDDDISGDQLIDCTPSNDCELDTPGGQYYLEKIDMDGDEYLAIDPGGGTIEIAVDEGITLAENATIEVTGPGRVKVYMAGNHGSNRVEILSNANVTEPNQNATRFWLYGKPGITVRLDSNAVFVGVLYAPGTATNPGDVKLNSNAKVYGGIVATVEHTNSNAEVHFDEALQNVKAVSGGGGSTIPTITFLHVSISRVNVTGT